MTTNSQLPHHQITGNGETTVFLLHGAYGDGRYFAHTGDVLVAAGYRVVIWDCPGYAGSPAAEDESIEGRANVLTELVQSVGSSQNVLLGHSMGGIIAPKAATLIPDQVHALVLSHTSPGLANRSPEEQKKFIAERLDPISDGQSVQDYAPELLASMMGPNASGPLVDRVIEVVCEISTDTFKSSMRAIIEYNGGEQALKSLTQPTLLVSGEHDPACPPVGMRQMHELVSNSEYHEVPGVGHYGFAEQPSKYESIVIDFLERAMR